MREGGLMDIAIEGSQEIGLMVLLDPAMSTWFDTLLERDSHAPGWHEVADAVSIIRPLRLYRA